MLAGVIKALRAANFTGQLYGGDAIMDPGLLRYVDKKDVRGLLGSDVSFGELLIDHLKPAADVPWHWTVLLQTCCTRDRQQFPTGAMGLLEHV